MAPLVKSLNVEVEHDVACTVSDGTILRADVYRPEAAEGPFPVLLTRTPYGKSAPLNADSCRMLAARGYITVAQDIRGMHASDGEYLPWWQPGYSPVQAQDGYDSVEWAARLPWSDGRVGTFGVSYMARNSWLLAKLRPPSLKAMHVAGLSPSNLDVTSGIFDLGRRLQWMYMQAADQRRRAGRHNGPLTAAAANDEWQRVLQNKWVWHLPVSTIPDYVFDRLTPHVRDSLGRQATELYNLSGAHDGLNIPVCITTGWWDRHATTAEHFALLQERGAPEVRKQHRLIVGPWSHAPATMRRNIGPYDYGPEADYPSEQLIGEWFDWIFKGVDRRRVGKELPVHLFLLNDANWSGFSDWPPPEGVETSFYLHSNGAANTDRGNGTLSDTPPGHEPADRYVYDPADPVMSLFAENSQNLPVDQTPIGHRQDNLVYQTAPLKDDVIVAGRARVELWIASDAPDTDFAVKLIEVGPDCLALNISAGIARARYREGFDREVMLEKEVPTRIDIDLFPVGIRFRKGSRIRLDVASSDFPAFDRNHNTGGNDWEGTELRVAHQTVFHDASHRSRLVLPVVPQD